MVCVDKALRWDFGLDFRCCLLMFLSRELLAEPRSSPCPGHPGLLRAGPHAGPFQHPSSAGPGQLLKCLTLFQDISQLIGGEIYVQV